MRTLADRSDGVAMSPGRSPSESTTIRTEGSGLLSAALAANFEGFWKLPAGMLTVERGERMTAVRLTAGDGRPADVPPLGLPSLSPVGITAPDLTLVDGQAIVSFDLYEAMRRFYFEDFHGRAAAVSRAASLARRLYYHARPAIPRRYQLALAPPAGADASSLAVPGLAHRYDARRFALGRHERRHGGRRP